MTLETLNFIKVIVLLSDHNVHGLLKFTGLLNMEVSSTLMCALEIFAENYVYDHQAPCVIMYGGII